MKRILVIGCGGAGKSTLSRQLGDILGIPVHHLDTHFWKPNWESTPESEWRPLIEELASGDSWIIDGNYGSTFDIRFPAADTIIYLDYPTRICLWRAIKRRIQYNGKTRPDMGAGCPEKIDWEYINWILGFNRRTRPSVLKRIKGLGQHAEFIHLRSPRQTERFFKELKSKLPAAK